MPVNKRVYTIYCFKYNIFEYVFWFNIKMDSLLKYDTINHFCGFLYVIGYEIN